MELGQEPPKKSSWGRVVTGIVALVLIALIVLYALPNLGLVINFFNFGGSSNYTNTGGSYSAQNPSINNSGAAISYPNDYTTLANYALVKINNDRAQSSLSNVTLSPIQSGQQHADSMLYYGYFSHWDTQGYKPYMRYTLLNGTGYVEENVAYEYTTLPSFVSTLDVEKAISSLEYQMMYNDSSCCNNGHRDNILTAAHNRVSIGIAYDSTHVYFVEDFQTYFAELGTPIVGSGNSIQLVGNTTQSLNPNAVLIFYDPTPAPISASLLGTTYYGPYNQGNFTGGVLPPCNGIFGGCAKYVGYTTVYASTWQVSGNSIDIRFSLNNFVQKYGGGVYTIYLVQGDQNNPVFLTSISVFVSK